MNPKGHSFTTNQRLFAAERRRAQPRPIDPRMRLRLPRPSIKGLPSLLITLFLIPECAQPVFRFNREEFHVSIRLPMHIDFL